MKDIRDYNPRAFIAKWMRWLEPDDMVEVLSFIEEK